MFAMQRKKILVAIPVFNESAVFQIVQQIKNFDLDVLVIDDGSTMCLHKELTKVENIRMIVHPRNLGYGKTIIDAFQYAINNGYEYLLTIDGDGQHEPMEIQRFLQEIPFFPFDILSGSRYYFSRNIEEKVPRERYIINRKITSIVNRITGFRLTDSFCGFKAYRVEKLKLLHLTEYGYGMPLQLWMQAWKAGLLIREIPVKLIYIDLTKRFHGILENPDTRMQYYKMIIRKELSDAGYHNAPRSRKQAVRY
ncbi:MAG: glycosyltransferase family 2 protein [Candidatus Brocadia sp. WS118]|nr:MAG: glycosyltransferase family 2 protein [Candidatus Brocadia sp. WS118]